MLSDGTEPPGVGLRCRDSTRCSTREALIFRKKKRSRCDRQAIRDRKSVSLKHEAARTFENADSNLARLSLKWDPVSFAFNKGPVL